jgi:hypothetical protein
MIQNPIKSITAKYAVAVMGAISLLLLAFGYASAF